MKRSKTRYGIGRVTEAVEMVENRSGSSEDASARIDLELIAQFGRSAFRIRRAGQELLGVAVVVGDACGFLKSRL